MTGKEKKRLLGAALILGLFLLLVWGLLTRFFPDIRVYSTWSLFSYFFFPALWTLAGLLMGLRLFSVKKPWLRRGALALGTLLVLLPLGYLFLSFFGRHLGVGAPPAGGLLWGLLYSMTLRTRRCTYIYALPGLLMGVGLGDKTPAPVPEVREEAEDL